MLTTHLLAHLALAPAASAQPAPERDHDITPEDGFTLARLGGLAVSPDERWIVYTESRWSEPADGRVSDLWRVPTDGGAPPERLTFDDRGEWGTTFSDDGRHLYFLEAVDGPTQVWRMPAAGGEAVPVTAADDGVQRFALLGDALWYTTAATQPRDDDFAGLRGAHGDLSYGYADADTTTLHRLDLQTWRTEEHYDGSRTVYAFAPSPDGSTVAMLTQPDSELIFREGPSEVAILDVASGEIYDLPDEMWRDQAPSPYGWLGGLAWKPDGSALFFEVDFDGHPPFAFVARFDGASHLGTERVAMEDPWTLRGGAAWLPGSDRLCFTVSDTARLRLVCRDDDGAGAVRELTPEDDAVVWSWAPLRRGAVMVRGGMDHFGDLYALEGRRLTRLTTSNPQTASWRLPQIQRVQWTAPDGQPVEGILELPPGWTSDDGPLPTIITIHGGPTSATHYHLSHSRAAFSTKGWAVMSPNYRGSIGYGDEFLVELVGRENDVEVADILAGVDWMVDQGYADPDKMAVMGWSNGGYLTNCVISQTDRFKAASSGAGVFDQTMQWAIEDTPGHVINYMEGLPWEQPQAVQDASPLFSADKITTPTLIHVGEFDARTPAAHSRALFRALSFYLGVPTELIVYPGEGHGLGRMSHREAKMAWDIAWFERWVLEIGVEEDEGDGEE